MAWPHLAAIRRRIGPLLDGSVRIAFPPPGGHHARCSGARTAEPLFRSPAYRRFASGLLFVQLGSFALWQVHTLGSFLRAHSQCSWRNVVSEGRWWAAIAAHVCHRDAEHMATNLGMLLVPTFLLQRLLSWQGALALCTVAATGSSSCSLAFTYFTFAPAEPKSLGCTPWAAPRFNSLAQEQRCPKGHELGPVTPGKQTVCSVHSCDRCGRDIQAHEKMNRCNVCDYDLCLDCCCHGTAPVHLHRFRNAFDEFCFLREAELAIGFDTMTSDTPYISHPHVLHSAERLDLRKATKLCQPYLEWWEQSSRGSMGSSALASALSAACALWVGELALRGWRHPLLSLFCAATALQPLVDLARVRAMLGPCDGGSAKRLSAEDADFVGHLAGSLIGALWYCVLLRRAGLVVPLYPLVPLARAKL